MIAKELCGQENNILLYKVYSTNNYFIMNNETKILYKESIDPENAYFTYQETNIPIPTEQE